MLAVPLDLLASCSIETRNNIDKLIRLELEESGIDASQALGFFVGLPGALEGRAATGGVVKIGRTGFSGVTKT